MNKGIIYCIGLGALILLLFVLNLLLGSVSIPASDVLRILMGDTSEKSSWQFIVLQSRLPQAITAVFCGASLAVSGLMLQTAFRNPLAGPSIFGINSGAGLGVALVMLFLGGGLSIGSVSVSGFAAILLAAFLGAMFVTLLLLLLSRWVRSNVMLLIVGMMVGYLSSSLIALLNFAATEEGVRSYMVWGLGSFGGVSMQLMPVYSVVTLLSLGGACMLVKPLNALLLGERYASNLGINTLRLRSWLLVVTGLLCAVATAFCGPIAFLGLAVPHMARLCLGTANHRQLMPATILMGAVVALACHLLSMVLSRGGAVPINALTPLFGAPVIIYVILKK
jgi:iron complex transport system permease protein